MGYAKHEAVKKQKKLVSKSQRNIRKVLVNFFKVFLVLIITVVIAGAGACFGMIKGILDNAPDIDDINIVPKGFRSVIYDKDGNVEKEISTINSNREYVYYEEIPTDFVNAFVAIEDERFWQHNGIDVKGILRAGIKGIMSGNFDEGASTITQQLIKNNVFNVGIGETSFLDKLERKIQEQYLALELEKKYTKEEIVEYYLNTIYLGRGVHGIQTASEKYFGKKMDELTVSEISVIAGITQNPSKYDPISMPEQNAKRRKMVLDKMLELDYITKEQYDEAIADNVYDRIAQVHESQVSVSDINTYYEDAIIDRLRDDFMEMYGVTGEEADTMIFTGGYQIYSVQDKDIQNICDTVINDPSYFGDSTKVGLDYRLTLIGPNDEEINYSLENFLSYYKELTGNSKYNNIYANEDAARAACDQFKEAKLIETGGTFSAEHFACSPQPQFSFTLMDQKTGYVKAIVGGRGPKLANRSLNRATDSKRQPGSTYKIVAVYAPYIDTGMGCLASAHKDEEYNYLNGRPVYNASGGYQGDVTVRTAIQSSINVVAVKTITEVTPEVAYDYLINFGYTTLVDDEVGSDGIAYSDKTQACALGGLTYGVYNIEMTAAYACIANMGVYTKPVFYSKVYDHDGNLVIDNTTPTTHEVIKPTTAWQLIDAMKSVVNGGTGYSAKMTCGVTCAGKTGTTSNNYDLWFCGMTPYYTASIWMGYDSNIDLGGGSAHKRMWRDIMDQVAIMEGQDTSVDFEKPDGISSCTVCQISGLSPAEGCPTFSDYCAVGFSPKGACPGHEKINMCMDSKCVATSKCPNQQEFLTYIDEETGDKILVDAPDDMPYTEQVCPLHPESAGTATISTSAGPGGTISEPVVVEKGQTVTVYITPQEGHNIESVTINGANVGPVSSYTIVDVQSDYTITATFTP